MTASSSCRRQTAPGAAHHSLQLSAWSPPHRSLCLCLTALAQGRSPGSAQICKHQCTNGVELLQLLTKSCKLVAVESVLVHYMEEAEFTQCALFARICVEATCLRYVSM